MSFLLKHSAGAEDVAQLVEWLQETLISIPSISQEWWGLVSGIPVLGSWRWDDQTAKVIFSYRVQGYLRACLNGNK